MIENAPCLDENSSPLVLANFAALLKENSPLSKLESFDYSCIFDENRNEQAVPFRLWNDLVDLMAMGTIKKFYIRSFKLSCGKEL